jgi:ion channel-forming bestrophin family protein
MKHITIRWLLPLPLYPQVLPIVGLVVLYCLIVFGIQSWIGFDLHTSGAVASSASGIILGVLLVVHTNTANMRWWEGRSLWGNLINHSRNLSLKLRQLVPIDATERQELAKMIVGFAHALRMHLREGVRLSPAPGVESDLTTPKHVPLWLAHQIYARVGQWLSSGRIDANLLRVLDEHLRGFMDICGACEKIRFTPLPLSFRALLRHGIVLYLLVAPIYIIEELGIWSVPAIAVVCYFVVGTELLAEDVEEPFGIGPDNLDLDAYCRTIELSVGEVLQ